MNCKISLSYQLMVTGEHVLIHTSCERSEFEFRLSVWCRVR